MIETITTQKQVLSSLLHKTGTIVFIGFDVNTAEDINDVETFRYEEYSPLDVTALRYEMPIIGFFSIIDYRRTDFSCWFDVGSWPICVSQSVYYWNFINGYISFYLINLEIRDIIYFINSLIFVFTIRIPK